MLPSKNESEYKNTILNLFSETVNELSKRSYGIQSFLAGTGIEYEDGTGEKQFVRVYSSRLNFTILKIKVEMEAIKDLYPQITEDGNFVKLYDLVEKDCLIKKRRPWKDDIVDNQLLENIVITLEPIINKIRITESSMKDLENELFLLKKTETSEILKPLIATKKSTSELRDSIKTIKSDIADGEIWKNYRRDFKELNGELRKIGLVDFLKASEKMITSYNKIYSTSDKLNEHNIKWCLGFLNEIEDKLDDYDRRMEKL